MEAIMKQRILSIIVALSLSLSSLALLAGCDKGDKGGDKTTEAPTSAQTEVDTATDTESDPENDPESDPESGDATEPESESESEPGTDPETEDEGETECFHPYAATLEGHWKPACSVCGKKDGKIQDHEYEQVIEDEGDLWLYSFVCKVCEFAASEQEVPYEINSFYSAGELSMLGSGALKGSVGFASGTGYAKYSAEGGGSVTVSVLSGAEATFPSGSYLVMKVRLGASQKNFSASIKSTGANSAYTMNFTGLKSGWSTIIVDITKTAHDSTDKEGNPIKVGYVPDAYDNYYLSDFSITGKAAAGESFDVSYVMFCDTLADAESFVEGDMNVYRYFDIINEAPDSENKVCVDENGNPIIHEYIGSETGHTLKEGCTQCGLEAVEDEPHTFGQIEIDGDLTYACLACHWSQFGANINKYFSAQDIKTMATTYYQITVHPLTEDSDGVYASFSGKGNTAQVIFARDNNVSSAVEQASAFEVGKANFFIIRMRTNTPAVDFAISYRAKGEGAVQSTPILPLSMTEAGEWATYVIDLPKVLPGAYIPDENGNYTLGTFYYHIGYKDFTADVQYDIGFMAFVDSWDEVKALVTDETVVNVTASDRGQLVNTADRSCAGEHAYATLKTEDGWLLACSSCGIVERDFGIGSSVELLMSAEVLKNVRTDSDGKIDLEYMVEDGESFIRLSNLIPNGAGWMGLTFTPAGSGTVTGQYMVMKIRVGENGLGTNYMHMYTGTTVGLKSEGQAASFKVVEDGQWHYVVIDLKARMGDPSTYLVPNADGTYTVKYLQIRPFSGTQAVYGKDETGKTVYGQKVMADDYMDIGYIAYCDNIEDLKDLIHNDTYEWSLGSAASVVRNTADNSCVEHTPEITVEGATQTVTCTACGETLRSFTVPEGVNWYSDYSVMSTYLISSSKGLYDAENNVTYNRFTSNVSGHINVTGGGGSGAATEAEYDVGSYLVLKYRSNYTQLLLKAGSANESGKTTTFGDKYKPIGEIPGDEWNVVVLSLEDLTVYTEDEDGKSAVYVMLTTYKPSGAESYYVDIAYAAVVDSIEEARTLLDEGETYIDLGKSFVGEGVRYDRDGNVVE